MSQGNATFKAESWKDAVGVPLPSDEASFLNSRPELREAFTDNGRLAPISADCDQDDSPPHSIMGEWVKSFSLW
jgi:hypothetical protein